MSLESSDSQLETWRRRLLTPSSRRLFRIAIRVIGAAAFAGLIWVATPFIGFGDFHPFEEATPRLAAIFVELVVVGILIAIGAQRRKSGADQIAAALSVEDSDAPVLAERMKKALSVLRARSGGRANYLYDLPWYVLIGPPGSGKTTALVNSGLKFPLQRAGTADAIAGVGGTRYCDWWFTEDAVLIDTAGRYTTQDSDAYADQASWLGFLALLKRFRPKQPINGVLVAISLEDLLTLSPQEVTAHADAIRARIVELHQQLAIDFPVYALFTKADLVIGFMEFFHDLDERGRAQVWGATFRTKQKTASPLGALDDEFEGLIARVNETVPDKLEAEKDAAARVLLFGFPAQLAALKQQTIDFLTQIFDPARYDVRAPLRGFYFTSGTQQGTPIDKLLGALSKSFAAEGVAAPVYSGRGRSFFLTDLIKKVIIGEAGFVANSPARKISAVASFIVVFIVAPLIAGLFWVSYARNGDLVQLSKNAAARYKTLFSNLTTADSSRDLVKILPALEALRSLPGGYGSRAADDDAMAFGLDQGPRLHSSAETAYDNGLERLFRPRLIYRVEDRLAANIDDPVYLYDALKVYLMLGGLKTADRKLLVGWMERDWTESLYPGAKDADNRKELEKHLIAMLDLETGDRTPLALNGALVARCQATLARVNIAQRTFDSLQAKAKADLRDDWHAKDAAGEGALNVFDDTLRAVNVPYFYTKAGFEKAFLARLDPVTEDTKRDRWVLGPSGDLPAVALQFETLSTNLASLYARASISAWHNALDKLQIRNLLIDRPTYPLLKTAGLTTSPIGRLLESIQEETDLQHLPQLRDSPAGDAAAQAIATSLHVYHGLVTGEAGSRPIDTILTDISEIHTNLNRNVVATATDDQATRRLTNAIDKLASDAALLPQPFQRLLKTVASDAKQEGSVAVLARAVKRLRDTITYTCQETIVSRFPFKRDATRDVALDDFGRMFAPRGLIDQFVSDQVLTSIDKSGNQWKWRANAPLAKLLSATALADFQRAAEIRDAYFADGATTPAFSVTVTPPTTTGARMEIDTTVIAGRPNPASSPVRWPGSASNHRAALTYEQSGRAPSNVERNGVWALHRLIDTGKMTEDGTAVFALGDRELRFRFESDSGLKALDLNKLRGFHCPSGA
jgi:type VI secretion system protein ImpL